MATRVYLDTWLLRALISKESKKEEVRREVTRLRSNSFDVIVPQIVLGEAFGTIMRDYDNPNEVRSILNKLYDHLRRMMDTPGSCIPPVTVDIMEKAKELKKADSYLGDTDIIIVAQALLDRTSQRLLTADTKLTSSTVIKEEERKMRQNDQRDLELRIVDGL